MRRRMRPWMTVGVALLGACASTSDPIEGDDRGVLLPAVRGTWTLRSFDAARAAESAGGDAPAELRLDVELAFGSGSFDQRLRPGEQVQLDEVTFSGPATVAVEFDLHRALVDVRYATAERSGLRAEAFAGLGVSYLEVEARSGGVRDGDQQFALGPLVGAGASYRPAERWRLFLEASLGVAVAEGWEEVRLRTLELGALFAATPSLEVGAGWRDLRYRQERGSFGDSDLDLGLSGPLVSLRLHF